MFSWFKKQYRKYIIRKEMKEVLYLCSLGGNNFYLGKDEVTNIYNVIFRNPLITKIEAHNYFVINQMKYPEYSKFYMEYRLLNFYPLEFTIDKVRMHIEVFNFIYFIESNQLEINEVALNLYKLSKKESN